MKALKPGQRHSLVLYKRAMDRLWKAALPFSLICLAVWWQITGSEIPLIETQRGIWLLVAGVIAGGIGLFALLVRSMAYVQAHRHHIRLATPFLRLKISYRRVRSVHSASFSQNFPPQETGWARRNFLEPFLGSTVLVVELHSFPLHPGLLRLFLPAHMFSPQTTGLVMLVDDWVALSTEIDTRQGAWRQEKARSSSGRFGPNYF